MNSSKPPRKHDINDTVTETPLLRQIIAKAAYAIASKGGAVDWWHYQASPHLAKVAEGMTDKSKVKFELEWRILTRRGVVKPWVMEAFTAHLPEKFANAPLALKGILYGCAYWVYMELANCNSDFLGCEPLAGGFGIHDPEMADDIRSCVACHPRFCLSLPPHRVVTIRIDGVDRHFRLEDDPDVRSCQDAIVTGLMPGASIVYYDNGDVLQTPCRSLNTTGIIIGSRAGPAYERQANGSLKRVTPSASDIRKDRGGL